MRPALWIQALLLSIAVELQGGCETVGDVLSGGSGGAVSSGGQGDGGSLAGAAPTGGGGGSSDGGTGVGGDVPQTPFVGTPTALDLGDYHTCFIADGRLYCFGRGGDGALGNGQLESRVVPTRSGEESDYLAVALGARSTCALRTGGNVWCSGAGESGQLGNGTFSDSSVFVPVELPAPVRELAAGHGHYCAVLDDGRLFCWGANAEGQLGQPDPFPDPGPPSALPLQVAPGWFFRTVSGGQGHTCAIRDDERLYCWGRNAENELGLGDASADQMREPQLVTDETAWLDVACGQGHTCGLRSGGRVECWGDNSSGQLGLGDTRQRDVPTVVFAEGATAIALDTFHTCLLGADGVSCAGRGIEGALGTGIDSQLSFVLAPDSGDTLLVRAGRFHTCVAGETHVSCTGQNDDGRLGVGDTERRSRFSAVLSPREF